MLYNTVCAFNIGFIQNLLVAGLSQTKELCDSSQKVPSYVEIIASTGVAMPKPPKLIEGEL